MSAFVRGKSGIKSIYVPTRNGGLVQRSTGTKDARIVRDMKRMVNEIRDKHLWPILDAIQVNRITLAAAYQSYVANRLSELAAQLSAVNLSEHLDGWIGWVRANRQEGVRTADVYWQQVTALVPEGGAFPASDLTRARVIAWLTALDCSSGTKRKYLYALKSFVRYLLDINVLTSDPLAGLKAPKKNAARERWESAATDERIVKAARPRYRAFFAFIKATGCDVGSALRAQVGDLDLKAGTVNVRGTKTDRRRVHAAIIEPWALPYLRQHVKAAIGNGPLFPDLDRHMPSKHHREVCALPAIGVKDYTLKDSRHSVAVRMRLAGKSFEAIAAQLGTSVFQTVTVYSRYTPEQAASAAQQGASR